MNITCLFATTLEVHKVRSTRQTDFARCEQQVLAKTSGAQSVLTRLTRFDECGIVAINSCIALRHARSSPDNGSPARCAPLRHASWRRLCLTHIALRGVVFWPHWWHSEVPASGSGEVPSGSGEVPSGTSEVPSSSDMASKAWMQKRRCKSAKLINNRHTYNQASAWHRTPHSWDLDANATMQKRKADLQR